MASRVGEAGDVALNASAVATGTLFALCLLLPAGVTTRPDPRRRATLAAACAVIVVTFGGFFHCAHLGYEIRDPGSGWIFRSCSRKGS